MWGKKKEAEIEIFFETVTGKSLAFAGIASRRKHSSSHF